MTILFTKKEKEWLKFDLSKEYPFSCKDGAPEDIRKSIEQKIKAHKEWLKHFMGGVSDE